MNAPLPEALTHASEPIRDVEVGLVAYTERSSWNRLMKRYHYLGFRSLLRSSFRATVPSTRETKPQRHQDTKNAKDAENMNAVLQSWTPLSANRKDFFGNPVTHFTRAIRSCFPLCLPVFVVHSSLLAVNGYQYLTLRIAGISYQAPELFQDGFHLLSRSFR